MEEKNRGEKVSGSKTVETEILQQKINAYSDMLYRIAFLQLRNNQDAEDVVQETFYQFIKNKHRFESTEHEKAWLIKVTLNGCRKVWRSAWYRHRDVMPEQETAVNPAEIQENRMENSILRQEQSREIMEAVMKLPRKYREVIHLFYFQQMSIREICLVTERKESTVTSQLTRGRELLRKNLREEYQYE